jgi:hypothetical protein
MSQRGVMAVGGTAGLPCQATDWHSKFCPREPVPFRVPVAPCRRLPERKGGGPAIADPEVEDVTPRCLLTRQFRRSPRTHWRSWRCPSFLWGFGTTDVVQGTYARRQPRPTPLAAAHRPASWAPNRNRLSFRSVFQRQVMIVSALPCHWRLARDRRAHPRSDNRI